MNDPGKLIHEFRNGDKLAAARVLRQLSDTRPDLIYPLRRKLLKLAAEAEGLRVQWNLTIVIGRLPLRGADKALAVDLMFERLRGLGGLNRTFALQGLFDLSADDPELRARVMPLLREALDTGTAAMRARARRLLKQVS